MSNEESIYQRLGIIKFITIGARKQNGGQNDSDC